ncbi:hypothetical protein F3J27_03590 [Enterobacter sp. Ap-916]|uniref:hypothetical protein n=1 Tax=unclassified Enterobacter TaxID=2608935 RepID=UPI00141EE6A3|nr:MULTISPECIES: hypothetical protein [unclassified Enterobacter]NIF57490.1 hypothetical protein [Enterobacter sp. Ap-867]NIG28568.1 hypothetical protein [Enterobacter sp. Ap-916]
MTKQLEALIARAKHIVENGGLLARDTSLQLIAALEQAQQQETSPLAVKLHKRSVGEVMHMSGFSRDYAEGWCAGNDNAIHEIRAAGGTVSEGE